MNGRMNIRTTNKLANKYTRTWASATPMATTTCQRYWVQWQTVMTVKEHNNEQANQQVHWDQCHHNANKYDEYTTANSIADADAIGYNDKCQQEDNKWANQPIHQDQYQQLWQTYHHQCHWVPAWPATSQTMPAPAMPTTPTPARVNFNANVLPLLPSPLPSPSPPLPPMLLLWHWWLGSNDDSQ